MEGIYYFETFVPLVKISSIRILLVVSKNTDWIIHQMDVVSAFLNGDLDDEVYMHHPKDLIHNQGLFCKLQKALYVLKQSLRAWNERIDSFLLKKGNEKGRIRS